MGELIMANQNKYLDSSIIPLIKAKVDAKQDKLVSGTNIKTFNNQSLLGAGDIDIPKAQLYATTGQNEDGAMTQKAVTDSLESISTQIEEVDTATAKTVQLDLAIKEDVSSTVTLVKTSGALNSDTTTTNDLALPVASAASAGVINPATYQSIQDTAEKVESILNASVSVDNLTAEPTQEQLTTAWKTASGKETLINGAKILDTTNNKTWTYYSNNNTWTSTDNNNPTVEINAFTNTAAGIIKGDASTTGKIFAESDGTGSVNGWDTLTTEVSNLSANTIKNPSTPGTVGQVLKLKENEGKLEAAWANDAGVTTTELDAVKTELTTQIDTNTGGIATLDADKQDKLVASGEGQNIKTLNGESLLGAGNVEITMPQAMTTEEFEEAWNNVAQ